jgi:hypothetical protein
MEWATDAACDARALVARVVALRSVISNRRGCLTVVTVDDMSAWTVQTTGLGFLYILVVNRRSKFHCK